MPKWLMPALLVTAVLGTFGGLDQRRRSLNFDQVVSNPELEEDYGIKIKTRVKEGNLELLELTSKKGGMYSIQIFDRHNCSTHRVSLPQKLSVVKLDFDPGETIILDVKTIGRARIDAHVGTIEFTDRAKQGKRLVGVFFF